MVRWCSRCQVWGCRAGFFAFLQGGRCRKLACNAAAFGQHGPRRGGAARRVGRGERNAAVMLSCLLLLLFFLTLCALTGFALM